jgi:putative hydrolase
MLDIKEDYHVHTNFNDHSPSDLSVANVVKQAEHLGLKSVAFTEHVRRSSEWIPQYLEEIDKVRSSGPSLKIITGFEAKILEDGSIDCSEEYFDNFVIASFHTTYGDKRKWFFALKNTIEFSCANVIGHLAPEESFDLSEFELDELATLLLKHDRIIELNAKYKRPPLRWLDIFKRKQVRFHLGSDAHSLNDVGNFESITNLITFVKQDRT